MTTLLQATGAVGVAVYGIGFIVVNTHLATYGIQARNPFEVRYVPAGVLLVAVLLFFFLLAGVRVIAGQRDVNEIWDVRGKGRWRYFWGLIALLHPFASIGFGLVVVSSFIGAVALQDIPIGPASVTGALFFIIDYPLSVSGAYSRAPRVSRLALIGVYVFSMYWFFARLPSGPTRNLFWMFVGAAFAINMVVDLKRLVRSIVPGAIITGVFVVLAFSTLFGKYLYGHVPVALGGGEPQRVRLLAGPGTSTYLNSILSFEGSVSEPLFLIGETDDELMLSKTERAGQALRLSRSLFQGILPEVKAERVSGATGLPQSGEASK